MSDVRTDLINKLQSKEAIVSIVDLGYVGLPLMLRFSAVG
jgi:UDP-N-acetyl-D-glucosamine dehydrogenase